MSQDALTVREPLIRYTEAQAQARGFTDAAAFVEHLIEADRRASRVVTIEQALAEGLASPEIEITPDWIARKQSLIASVVSESGS